MSRKPSAKKVIDTVPPVGDVKKKKAGADSVSLVKDVVAKKDIKAEPVAEKAPRKPTVSATSRPAKKAQASKVPAVEIEKPAKKDKKRASAKTTIVRECFFTFPEVDYIKVSDLKKRAQTAGCGAKKSEVLRAGLKVLSSMSDADFLDVIRSVVNSRSDK